MMKSKESSTLSERTSSFFSRNPFVENTNVRDDGRVDLVVDSTLCRIAGRLMHDDSNFNTHRFSHLDPPRPSSPPPQYSVLDPSDPTQKQNQPSRPPTTSQPSRSTIRLNIVIQVVGSRGDVQPFIALGTELRASGHRVRLATHDTFNDFVRSAGLEFYPIGGDPTDLMAFMVKNPGLIPSMDSLLAGEIQKKRAMVKTMLEGCWRSCLDADPDTGDPFVADAIIANPPSFAHVHCAQALSIPLHIMFTMPWTSTRQFSHPLANLSLSAARVDPGAANYISYWLVESMTWQGIGDVINEWRTTIDLEPVPTSEGPKLLETLGIPVTYCWSPALVPKPADWPASIDICGFFFREHPEYTPPDALASFLGKGTAPVYIGFGSIVLDDPEKLNAMLVQAVRSVGVRAIISKGWSKLGGDVVGPTSEGDIFYLGDCPHEWLFKHVSAVVHHGGAGTTACGLLNGRPTTIVPFFGDQPFWGEMVATAGAGPKPIHHKALNVDNFSAAIRYCLTPEASAAAQKIAASIQAETGVKQAVKSFHDHILAYNIRCDLLPERAAAWTCKTKSGKSIKLSSLAGEILVNASVLSRKQLKRYEINPIEIRNRRWDPVTGVVSAALHTGKGMLVATSDIVVKPVKTYRSLNAKYSSSLDDAERGGSATPPLTPSSAGSSNKYANPLLYPGESRSCMSNTAAMVSSSVSGVGGFFKAYSKGILLDIPLSAAEGLRAVPNLYGEQVPEREKITDWKSGAFVGGKQFVTGFSGGVSDLDVQPIKGANADGVRGAAVGLGKGFVGFVTKVLSAPLGLVAYSFEGIYQDIRSMTSKTNGLIQAQKHQEGIHELIGERSKGSSLEARVVEAFGKFR
ncbi:hypothetical protein jhhlp_007000 [Lomentospora prolificans]|uniref:Uncharacterized protein n=1 Tax=Lomentospora prolificans TaxID=41688 RepID=A0A2N3N1E1_9PEZI|nr:hypothetical protein jhhlp_007000 [Lomentospora prolificans]